MSLPVDEKTVATPSAAALEMVARAKLPRTLVGGTKAMRAAGQLYLPKEPAEKDDAYASRLARSTLFNAFGKTVADMTGKVFDKPIVLKKDVPAELVTFAEDIDLTGRHLNVFARDTFDDAMQSGIGYILTDMPQRPKDMPNTKAAERAAGIRPYLVYIPIERLLGWKSKVVDGVETLTQVRIAETVSEPDGEFHEKEVNQVRVIDADQVTPARWRTFRKAESGDNAGKWVEHLKGDYSLKKITLTPFYTDRTGFMRGKPPLEKLAEKNVEHWQSSSDQRNILHVARVPILFYAGCAENDELTIGVNSAVRNSNPEAKLTFVEHTGKAIESGDKDLKNLEFQMQAMGLQLLVDKPGQTATGEQRDNSKENSPLAMMARALGDALEISLGFMAEYMGLGEGKGGEVDVNTDYGITAGASVDVPNILTAMSTGQISKKTGWAELKRRGFLSDSFDPDTEKELLDAEPPELGAASGKGMDLNKDGDK